jgi:hypothetical protein
VKRSWIGWVLLSSSGCIDDRGGSVNVSWTDGTAFVAEDGATLRVEGSVYAGSPFDIYLDGAQVVVRSGAETFEFDTPTVEAPGFPVKGSEDNWAADPLDVALSVPNPLTGLDTFDGHCPVGERAVDVTLRIYSPAWDNDPEQPPPFVEILQTFPIEIQGTPPAPQVFFGSGLAFARLEELEDGDTLEQPVALVAAARETALAGVVRRRDTTTFDGHEVLEVGRGHVVKLFVPLVFDAPPLVGAASPSDYQLVSRGGTALAVHAMRRDGLLEWSQIISSSRGPAPEHDVLAPVALVPTSTGMRVIARSSYTLQFPTGDVPPAAGKAYGSVSFDLDPAGGITAGVSNARDVLAMVEIAGGASLVVSAELPPRTAPPGVLVERRDAMGALVFSHEEPAVAYVASVEPLADGGAMLLTEDRQLGRRTILVRLGPDGTVVYRKVALGEGPSMAPRPDGSALLAFRGTLVGLGEPAAGSAPDRPVPLLVEIGSDGSLLRAAQLGCEGWGVIGNTGAGTPALVGSFGAWATLGAESLEASPETVITSLLE